MSCLSIVSWAASAWVWLITSSMPSELRDRQRAERRAHVCDHIEHSTVAGQTPMQAASELAWALVIGVPADIVFAISHSARFVKANPNEEIQPNWRLMVPVWAVVVISIVVVMIPGPEHAKQNSHLLAVRLVRGVGGIVLFLSAARAMVRWGLSKTRKGNMVFGAIASSVVIGAYLVRMGLSPW